MKADQNGVCFLFPCQASLLHFSLPLSLALEGVLLIRAVSPATPQGSVSQPDSGTHIHAHPRTHRVAQYPKYPHTHTHTRIPLSSSTRTHILSSCCYFDISSLEGSSLKMHLSHLSSNPPPAIHPSCHLYLRLLPPLALSLTALLS